MAGRIDEAVSFLMGAWRSRPLSKRVLSAVAVLMAISGSTMLAYPWLTDIYSSRAQSKLSGEFALPDLKTRFSSGKIDDGEVLLRIIIPKIGVDALIVEGTDANSLRAGAGHYKRTALPCQPGNVGIAGHRTTYGKPFNRIDELVPGDEITLITPFEKCSYRAVPATKNLPKPRVGAAAWITRPDDGAVLGPLEGSFLTLTTCHPKG
ncbi:MAG: sortase, partial [Actinomycetota bacterium]